MDYLFKLAYRNIIRAKKRTTLTFLILSFGVAIYILLTGFFDSMDEQNFTNIINFETGHFKIRNIQYDEDRPFVITNYINNYQAVEKKLLAKKYVRGITERISFQAEADNSIDTYPCMVLGVNPEKDGDVFILTNFITSGKLRDDGAVIGESLAKDLEVGIDDSIFLTFRNGQGVIDSIEMPISGLILSPDPNINNATVLITLNDAMKYLNINSVTELAVKTDSYKNFMKYHSDLQKDLPACKILSWMDLAKGTIAHSKSHKNINYFFIFFVAIIALTGIINTLLMSVYEKQREIGTLKALGMTNQETILIFMGEGFIIGLAGSILGILLSIIFNWYFVVHGLDITALMGGSDINIGYRVMGIIKSKWSISAMLLSFIISIVTGILASWYPASKAVKLQPMECLRIN